MIKELIKDISYDKISLDQALTRAKLIAYKIDNGEFISWINHELNGYDDSSPVPEYRKFYCDIFAKVENPYYGSRLTPIDLTEINKQVDINLYSYIHRSGILNIEKNLIEAQNANEQYGYIDFPIEIVKNVRDIFQNNDISAVRKRIQFGNLNNILNVAKQRLLDTLLELNKAFPDLEDEYMNDDKKDTASQIITTNIYGNNASSNVGVGKDFTQGISNSYMEKVEQVLHDLRQLGVPKEDISELEDIINNEPDKNKLGAKFLAWSSALMTKAVEKGIDVKVPEVLDAIQNLVV
ncbi:AbiTii domain-containing protein [Psychrobacter alimentarius]|uniref:AbiTii domain-containing protein n=1 Tax=Psychrobacter alimentarius TaxID=261164 RepID=UPI003FD6819B